MVEDRGMESEVMRIAILLVGAPLWVPLLRTVLAMVREADGEELVDGQRAARDFPISQRRGRPRGAFAPRAAATRLVPESDPLPASFDGGDSLTRGPVNGPWATGRGRGRSPRF